MPRSSNSFPPASPALCSRLSSSGLRRKPSGCCRASGRSSSASASSPPAARCRARCLRPRCGTWPPASLAWPGRTTRTPFRLGRWRSLSPSGSSIWPPFFIETAERTMPRRDPNNERRFAYDGLDRVIHEKARLGVLTSLVAHPKGLVFGDLKQMCGLTDGNLSRHLQVLQEAGLVEVTKGYEGNRPHTTCRLTKAGRRRYLEYLKVLEQVVRDAAKAAGREAPPLGRLGIIST